MAQNSFEQITETIHTPKIFSQYDKKKIPNKQNRRVHKVDEGTELIPSSCLLE